MERISQEVTGGNSQFSAPRETDCVTNVILIRLATAKTRFAEYKIFYVVNGHTTVNTLQLRSMFTKANLMGKMARAEIDSSQNFCMLSRASAPHIEFSSG